MLAEGEAWLGEGAYFIQGLFMLSGLGDMFCGEGGTCESILTFLTLKTSTIFKEHQTGLPGQVE
jgi:hypothetical protein